MTHASVETYDLTAGFPALVRVGRRGVSSSPTTGMVQRRQTLSSVMPSGQAAVRVWTLTTELATITEYQRAVALWDATAGGCEALDLTIRGFDYGGGASETVQVRIVGEPMVLASIGPNLYSYTMTLEEFSHAP